MGVSYLSNVPARELLLLTTEAAERGQAVTFNEAIAVTFDKCKERKREVIILQLQSLRRRELQSFR